MKKTLALILALVMALSCVGVTAFAYECGEGQYSDYIIASTLKVGDVIPARSSLLTDGLSKLAFYQLNPAVCNGSTERIETSLGPTYLLYYAFNSIPNDAVLQVITAYNETDKTVEFNYYASAEDVFGNTGSTTITAIVPAKNVSYDMVIPEAVTMTEAGIKEIGAPSVKNVQNATANTVISYTATGTQLTLTDSDKTMTTGYYTDSEGKNAMPATAIEVYKSSAVVDPLTTLYVGVAAADWDAAEPGTFTATVTFAFDAAEVTLTDGYYLIFKGETVDNLTASRKLAANPSKDGEYTLEWTFALNDAIKVVKVENEAITNWYKDGVNNEYKIDESKVGPGTVYFRPAGNEEWSYFYLTVQKD